MIVLWNFWVKHDNSEWTVPLTTDRLKNSFIKNCLKNKKKYTADSAKIVEFIGLVFLTSQLKHITRTQNTQISQWNNADWRYCRQNFPEDIRGR